MATRATTTDFNNKIKYAQNLVKFLNSLNDSIKLSTITSLDNLIARESELSDPTKADSFKDDVQTIVKILIDSFSKEVRSRINNLRTFAYTMDKSDWQSISALYNNLSTINNSNYEESLKSLENISKFIKKYDEIINKLKTKNIINNNEMANIDLKGIKGRKFKNQTKKASNSFIKIEELQERLKSALPNQKEEIIEEIDKELKKINSTNKKIERLRKKDGKIDTHQRSLVLKSSSIVKYRNETVLENGFSAEEINNKINDLKDANQQEANATTLAELYEARKAIKNAERALYGHRMTKRRSVKMTEAMIERQKIVEAVKGEDTINNNKAYQERFDTLMNQLYKLDKKIIGKRNAKNLYTWKGNKPLRLVGGSEIILPKQISELNIFPSEKARTK